MDSKDSKPGRGGARPGAGRPRGSRTPKKSGHAGRQAADRRLREALTRAGEIEIADYKTTLGPPPADVADTATWLARVGAAMVNETLHDASLSPSDRRKTIATLLARTGLVLGKAQFGARVEAIERALAELAAPKTPEPSTTPPAATNAPAAPTIIPARGTPLHAAWEARGALPPDGADVVEAPESSRAYQRLLAAEGQS